MKTINGDLIMEKDMTFNEDLVIKGNIFGKNGNRFNLKVIGNLKCFNVNCGDLNCGNLNCSNLNCGNLNCNNLNCLDLNCNNLNCLDLNFYATAIAYNSFKCKTWKARRRDYIIKCLDEKIRGEQKK